MVVIKAAGIEIEMEKGAFVQIKVQGKEYENLCNWDDLDPELQGIFGRIDKGAAKLMALIDSDVKTAFRDTALRTAQGMIGPWDRL